MPDTLMAYTPLGSRADQELKSHGSAARVILTEVAPSTMIDLRLDPRDSACVKAAGELLGIELPLASNTSAANDTRTVWWLGPDQWLVVAPAAGGDALVDALSAVVPSAVNVSDLRAEFELAGPHAADVLRKGCGIDLHPREFRPGDCAMTQLARVRAGIRQIDERPAYRILVERSVATYLWDWLTDAMREFTGK